jgi:hypothetical protein
VDCDEKPVMGYLAHALRLAREKVIDNFFAKEKDYKPILEIVDRRWKLHFDLPLLGAGKPFCFSIFFVIDY